MKYLAAFLLALAPAGLATSETHEPAREMVISMAQHFVQEQFLLRAVGDLDYHIEFDVASLVPQPEPNYWAVVGRFMSDHSGSNNYVAAIRLNSYVAAVRLICPDLAKVTCWRLEKLAINRKIVVDLGQPL